MRRIVLLAVLASMPAAAVEVIPRERNLHMTAEAGRELRVQTYASFRRDCTPNGVPQINVRTSPQHGALAVRPGTATIREVRDVKSETCAGQQMPGTAVFYTPAPGFHGTDRFDYDIIGTSTNHDIVTVDVQ